MRGDRQDEISESSYFTFWTDSGFSDFCHQKQQQGVKTKAKIASNLCAFSSCLEKFQVLINLYKWKWKEFCMNQLM